MADNLRPFLDRLRELTPALNEKTEAAGRVVQTVESYLNSLHVGLPCRILIDSNESDEGDYTAEYLEYSRYGDRFRFLITEIEDLQRSGGDHSETTTPWANCRRELKLASYNRLPELLAEIVKKVEATIQSIEVDTTTIEGLLPEVKSSKKKEDAR